MNTWKLTPQLIDKLFSGERPRAHSIKIVMDEISGKSVRPTIVIADITGEALVYVKSPWLVHEGNSFTLEGLDKAFKLDVHSA